MALIWRAGRVLLGSAAMSLIACDGDDGDDGPTGNQGSIQISATSTTVSVPQGSSGSIQVTLTRGGGFTGAVALAMTGLPNGIGVAIDPSQLVGSALQATVTFNVAGTVATGTYTGSIEASALSMRSAIDIQLTVSSTPSYSLVVTPTALTIPAGGSGSVDLQVNRTNLAAPVSLTLVNPPAGITASFNPTPVSANTSTATISVATNVVPGIYQATIEASATGLAVRNAVVALTVVPAPPAGKNVAYYFCNVDDVPAFLAFQDGNGTWQAVAGVASGSTTMYSFNIAQGRGAVLSVYPYSLSSSRSAARRSRAWRKSRSATLTSRLRSGSATGRANARTQAAVGTAYETYLLYGSTSDLVQDGIDACAQAEPTKTVYASIVGVNPGQYGIFSLGSATGIFDGAAAKNPYGLEEVPAGPQDLVGSRIVTPGQPPNRLILMRNLNVPDGGTLPAPIDYSGPASVAPATATATITGAIPGDQMEIFVDLITQHGSNQLWFDLAPSAVATRTWAGFNSASMLAGELHRLWAFASQGNGTFRVVNKAVGPVANQTLVLGAELPAPTTSLASGGAYPRFQFQGSIPGDYNKGISIDLVGGDGVSNAYYVLVSGAYLSPGTAYNVTMPDVALLTGFPADSRLTAGTNLIIVAALGFTGPGLYERPLTLGAESRGSYKTLSINVP